LSQCGELPATIEYDTSRWAGFGWNSVDNSSLSRTMNRCSEARPSFTVSGPTAPQKASRAQYLMRLKAPRSRWTGILNPILLGVSIWGASRANLAIASRSAIGGADGPDVDSVGLAPSVAGTCFDGPFHTEWRYWLEKAVEDDWPIPFAMSDSTFRKLLPTSGSSTRPAAALVPAGDKGRDRGPPLQEGKAAGPGRDLVGSMPGAP